MTKQEYDGKIHAGVICEMVNVVVDHLGCLSSLHYVVVWWVRVRGQGGNSQRQIDQNRGRDREPTIKPEEYNHAPL